MFTGIVRERGRVASVEGDGKGIRIRLDAPLTAAEVTIGDSVSLNGCCLTVVEAANGTLAFDAVPETLSRSSLDGLAAGAELNVESALRAGDPLGGHYVQGHVDAVGTVRSVEPEGESRRIWFDAPPDVLRYCVEKGSVAVDGVSLTIAELDDTGFAVALIPHTLAATTLGTLDRGARVNLEGDVLAKYVERLVEVR
ncbi:MAG: riboflavin synthase [Thermoleophilia bacterium]